MELSKKEIIKVLSVKGMPSELIYFTNDILIMRNPPIDLIENPAERGLPENLVNDYKMTVKKYFEHYKPAEEDNEKIINIITNPQVFEILKLLRSTIATRNVLEKLRKKGVDDIDGGLKTLWDNNIIKVFQDTQKNEYYALISDIHVSRIYPKYILDTIINQYKVKSKSDQVLIEYLSVLEDTYYELKSKAKIKAQEE